MVPRTLTAKVSAETGEDASADPHGETILSEEDRIFIRTITRQEAPAADRPGRLT
ncbi:hypothetical protein [Arthrobacter sp. ISL-65]|uniref:hypothetical protein n=1 Tax=Arthrobacter sp. ISL-65 TaxID=2819112 RepID=UPI002035880F|nr:hypothetical protein [Arthrobacter sp. ISL-65]